MKRGSNYHLLIKCARCVLNALLQVYKNDHESVVPKPAVSLPEIHRHRRESFGLLTISNGRLRQYHLDLMTQETSALTPQILQMRPKALYNGIYHNFLLPSSPENAPELIIRTNLCCNFQCIIMIMNILKGKYFLKNRKSLPVNLFLLWFFILYYLSLAPDFNTCQQLSAFP